MLKNLQNKDKGFTIIEVLIVLAVGGLIIAIVLLAVPALQRNQRNSARGTDASRIATAASNFASDNNGTLPSAAADAATILSDAGTLGQYKTLSTTATGAKSFSIQTTAVTAPTTEDTIILATGNKCGTGGATTTSGANTRQMALVYTVEQASGFKALCKDI